MLYPRIIPCLLVHNGGLIKTVQFKNPKYVGDPINAVKIFNEKEVDELMVLDIDASTNGKEPNYALIENLAFECRMPLCYGGGIKTVQQASRIFSLGVEKIAISSLALEDLGIVADIAHEVGRQSVVVVLDVKEDNKGPVYTVYKKNGTINTYIDPIGFCKKLEDIGVGEIVINSIDRDGTMAGYDMSLIHQVRDVVSIPLTALGGASSLDDIGQLIHEYGIIGAAAGSLFVFKGKFRAVLINYPTQSEKEVLMDKYFKNWFLGVES